MCICINCRHIKNCRTYSFIREQHYKLSEAKKTAYFYPNKTIIKINIKYYKTSTILDWDLKECSSFVEEPGYWLK
uniref:Ycf34 n=1 Tax=Tolypiocladia glomerulata TaxID=860646 RepID=A0A1Z1MV36_9FLOR|nr:hypothetical protein [Tolypiocladia glomerulata]ARW69712.1 hypothetical protein [Tolypiocladia glomerulata]